MNRLLLAALAAVITVLLAAPSGARADAGGLTCVIDDLRLSINDYWPEGYGLPAFQNPPDRGGWQRDVTGRATCTRPDLAQTITVELSAPGSSLSAEGCPESLADARLQGYGRLSGNMTFRLPGGLNETRPYRLAYEGDSGDATQTSTFTLGDAVASDAIVWNFNQAEDRCGYGSGYVNSISFAGKFEIPFKASNPKVLAKLPFAPGGSPGHPDPIAASADGSTLYVGTFTTALSVLADRPPPSLDPSKVYAISTATGAITKSWTIAGQRNAEAHGLTGIALDSAGRLYITDVNPARVIRLDPATGAQSTYATIPDLKPCDLNGTPLGATGNCSNEPVEFGDRKPLPNGAAFASDGSLYVTDTTQGTIWKVPPGGGPAQKWFDDDRLASFIGPNGIRTMADGRTLVFIVSNSQPLGAVDGLQGKVYKLPIQADGRPGALQTVWTSLPNEGPDSLAIASSGNIYIAEAGDGNRTGFVIVSPSGQVLQRRGNPFQRLTADIGFDTVADVAFVGSRVFFTNSSNFNGNPVNMAVFEYTAGESGIAVPKPAVP
jgi:sugar lactone lactonase YvrE